MPQRESDGWSAITAWAQSLRTVHVLDTANSLGALMVDVRERWAPALNAASLVFHQGVTSAAASIDWRGLAEWGERSRKWLDEAPAQLREALYDDAVIPHPDLTIDDLNAVLDTFRTSGPRAAVDKVDALHVELFADATFRAELTARWQASGRWSVLKDLLAAHDAGLYGVTAPTALAQAEGILAEKMMHRGKLKQETLREYVRRLSDSLFGPSVERFVETVLETGFRHGQDVPSFSRHAIMHGADVGYGTRERSLRLLVWVDYLLDAEVPVTDIQA